MNHATENKRLQCQKASADRILLSLMLLTSLVSTIPLLKRILTIITQESSFATDGNDQRLELQMEKNRKANLEVTQQFASSVVLIGFTELSCIMFLPKNSANNHILAAIAILGSLTLVFGFCLLMHTLFMLASRNIHAIHDPISKCLIISTWSALILAAVAPLSLFPKPYNFLVPIIFVAVLLTLGAHLYLKKKSNDKKPENQTENEEHTNEIARLNELSKAVVISSVGGLVGLLFGIHKNALNHAVDPVVLVLVFLTFTSFIFGISLMLLCQMGLMHLCSSSRKNFLKIGVGLCMFLLVLLLFAAVVISCTFLKWYTVMIFIPVLIAYGVWQYSIVLSTRDMTHNNQESIQEKQKSIQEEQFKLAYTNANMVISITFGALMAIFTGYLGSDEKNMHLNFCVILIASAFVSALVLMLLSYKPSPRSHIGHVVNILSFLAMSLLVFGVFSVFILEFMRL
ncbi:hypothetical protein LUZ63_003662 [Rhynchospora breviuscula]|uniref:Uncharacterized protein n=1 Tax=Rhynchospora breviuscula TaxID=2022672 RepID=A0A9Q0D154_9POAL|nr:hypothetical protein LUZ63_003662 [Rhynchospora breviuscula]